MSKPYDLEQRLVNFAASIALFCRNIPNDFTGQYYGNQLLRSSGSAALNFGETQGAQSDRDFRNKAAISLKELKETRINLKILREIQYADATKIPDVLNEVEELIKIIVTIIKNKS